MYAVGCFSIEGLVAAARFSLTVDVDRKEKLEICNRR
jgi:hypothetical protein